MSLGGGGARPARWCSCSAAGPSTPASGRPRRLPHPGPTQVPPPSAAVDRAAALLADAGCTLLVPPHQPPLLPSPHSLEGLAALPALRGRLHRSCLLEGLAASSPARLRQLLLPAAAAGLARRPAATSEPKGQRLLAEAAKPREPAAAASRCDGPEGEEAAGAGGCRPTGGGGWERGRMRDEHFVAAALGTVSRSIQINGPGMFGHHNGPAGPAQKWA
ncbi:hypothetical protein U9M48_027596 [Paspalum notatum var. saurae]|uniref:Uncharacterized protein n=1 Tax=Paspalum notatum var. saurae TaxID=547442 RepID=A0AAQ3TZ54_PASNO